MTDAKEQDRPADKQSAEEATAPELPLDATTDSQSAASAEQPKSPRQAPILPLINEVPFPQIIMPLVVNRESGIRLIDDVMRGDRLVGLVLQRNADVESPKLDDLCSSLCVAGIVKMLKFPDGSTRIVAQGLYRARLVGIVAEQPYLIGQVEPLDDSSTSDDETKALVLSLRRQFNELIASGAQISEELQVAVINTDEPGPLGDLMASGLSFSVEEKQQLLAEADLRRRLRLLAGLLRRQIQMQTLSTKIQGEATSELTRAQREQFLRQQLHAIRRELGEVEDESSEINEFLQRVDALGLPESAAKEARREIDRMAQMHPSTPEYHVIRGFLDTMLSLPWNIGTQDRLDIRRARRILDADHYDLSKVKQRILEFLSVRKLKKDVRGPILCFVGPPGVGKTSLGRSIARTMNRKFLRVSLGGVHDEAEIRGHRRTYIGAMPGKIIQGLRRLGANNPVFMLDEIDKLGRDFRGDPASALLEVLDPEQNNSFRDHYLDVEFDLSKVLFICTANTTATVPGALLDRMEVLELSGYSEEEKLAIARQYLVPKQLAEHGLSSQLVAISDDAVLTIIRRYTHEAGVRNLEREIAGVCRKIARQHAEGRVRAIVVDRAKAQSLLGPPKFLDQRARAEGLPGVARGLAWTPTGGEVLTIESIKTPGKNTLKLTGSLGDVMKESAHAALGYLRSRADKLAIDRKFFEDFEVHIHVPAGATEKDGPSAGVALSASLLSLACNRPIRPSLAMTGEITLTGCVLPVGGVKEKLLAARRDGIKTVILPAANKKDTTELPKEIRDDLELVFVEHMNGVVPRLFESPQPRARLNRREGKSPRATPNRPRPRPIPPTQPHVVSE